MLTLMLFGPPMAYTALNLYLLAKIQPLPITFLPLAPEEEEPATPRELVTA